MPDRHRIILTADAFFDLEGIAVFIRQHSPQNASKVADSILNAIDSLATMPNRFKRVCISKKRGSAVHAMVVRPFIIYYRIEYDLASVHILNFRHGSRRKLQGFD
jgi:plasmid stabilization system protein ParE